MFSCFHSGGAAGVGSYFQDALKYILVSLFLDSLSRKVPEANTHPSVQRTPCKSFRNH